MGKEWLSENETYWFSENAWNVRMIGETVTELQQVIDIDWVVKKLTDLVRISRWAWFSEESKRNKWPAERNEWEITEKRDTSACIQTFKLKCNKLRHINLLNLKSGLIIRKILIHNVSNMRYYINKKKMCLSLIEFSPIISKFVFH